MGPGGISMRMADEHSFRYPLYEDTTCYRTH